MPIINYWKQFESTGKVEDYLAYCKNSSYEKDFSKEELLQCSVEKQEAEKAGVNPYAGIRMCDRNSVEADAYRGI
ncbi:MAG: hypothetical protein IJF07_02795 [Lachnospiraceae bacterium]|nr:hypothetical protein [Lachnospiraceae bacterium]